MTVSQGLLVYSAFIQPYEGDKYGPGPVNNKIQVGRVCVRAVRARMCTAAQVSVHILTATMQPITVKPLPERPVYAPCPHAADMPAPQRDVPTVSTGRRHFTFCD